MGISLFQKLRRRNLSPPSCRHEKVKSKYSPSVSGSPIGDRPEASITTEKCHIPGHLTPRIHSIEMFKQKNDQS